MNDVTINFSKFFKAKMRRRDRSQLLQSAVILIIAGISGIGQESGILNLLPGISLLAGVVNLILAVRYDRFHSWFNLKKEIVLFRLTGFVLFLDGLNYLFHGKQYLQYAYFLLALIYVLFLPGYSKRLKSRLTLTLKESGIEIGRKLFPPILISNDEIEQIRFKNSLLELHIRHRKPKKFYPIDEDISEFESFKKILIKWAGTNKAEVTFIGTN